MKRKNMCAGARPEPLSIAELDEMAGKRVFVVFVGEGGKSRWETVRGGWGYIWYRSTWLAYAKKSPWASEPSPIKRVFRILFGRA